MLFTREDMLTAWIIIMLILVFYSKQFNLESYTTLGNYKRYCSGCGYKNKRECAKCTNCGKCTTIDGRSNCEPGDNNGPYYRLDCANWKYSDPYELDQLSSSSPTNLDIYPHYRWGNLRKGHWRFRNRIGAKDPYIDNLRCTSRLNRGIRNKLKSNSA